MSNIVKFLALWDRRIDIFDILLTCFQESIFWYLKNKCHMISKISKLHSHRAELLYYFRHETPCICFSFIIPIIPSLSDIEQLNIPWSIHKHKPQEITKWYLVQFWQFGVSQLLWDYLFYLDLTKYLGKEGAKLHPQSSCQNFSQNLVFKKISSYLILGLQLTKGNLMSPANSIILILSFVLLFCLFTFLVL